MNSTNSAKFLRPAASIIEKPEGFVIEADMPGVAREGVQLNVENDILTIVGTRKEASNQTRPIHRESRSLNYRRAFALGRDIDRSRVSAKFEQGVLQVFLPIADSVKPRRIDIAS